MDLQKAALNGFKSAVRVFLKDLEALPEEAYTQRFGPVTRTVADIVYEVNLVNDDIHKVIKGEETPPWPDDGWIKAPMEFQAKSDVIAAFEKSTNAIVATIEGLSTEALEGTVMTEHGESSRYQRCQFMGLHMWYHSGQLNFIQTLLGDDKWHWE